jgi:hypothetical protein
MNMEQRRQLDFLAADFIRKAKMVTMNMPNGAWEAPALGEKGTGGYSLFEFLFQRHQHVVYKALEVLVNDEDS